MKTFNFASMISAGGTTMESAVKAAQRGELNGREGVVRFVGVISNRHDAKGLEKAKKLQVPTFVVDRKVCKNREEFGLRLMAVLKGIGAEYVFQNGWLPLTPANVVRQYEGKIFNQHPGSLDPEGEEGMDFGGKGMHGLAPTCARLAYSWVTGEQNPYTESTVHHVSTDGKFDRGKIIRVEPYRFGRMPEKLTIEDLENDPEIQKFLIATAQKIQQALLPLEHFNVQEVIKDIAWNGAPPTFKRNKRLISTENKEALLKSKQLATRLFPNG